MFALLLIAPLMFSIQSIALKTRAEKLGGGAVEQNLFAVFYLATGAAVAAIAAAIVGNYNVQSALYGLIFGAAFYGFITLYNLAIERGPLSVTCFIFSLSMIVPVLMSMIFFGEPIKVVYIVALVLIVLSAYLINFANTHGEELKYQKGWLPICILGFLFNAAVLIATKLHAANVTEPNDFLFIATGNLLALVLSLVPFAVSGVKFGFSDVKPNKWFFICGVTVGVTTLVGNSMLSIMSGVFDGAIVYPTTNGLSLVFTLVCSRFLFKEEIKGKALVGMIIGVVAVILLSF